MDYLQKDLNIARAIGDRPGESITLGNLGIACVALEQYGSAVDYFQQQKVIAREIGDREGEHIAVYNLMLVHQQLREGLAEK